MGQKISVKIVDRTFSLTAASPEQERVFRMAADSVTRRYQDLAQRFVGKQPVELMAMVALNESIGRIDAQSESRQAREDVSTISKELGQYLDQH